jgi:hypothetical protein
MHLIAGLLIESSHLAQSGLGSAKTPLPALLHEFRFSLDHGIFSATKASFSK